MSGVTRGQNTKVASIWDAYVATPSHGKQRSEVALLYIPDVIGIWENSKLTADELAENGYVCMVIDIFNGDAIELNNLGNTDIKDWVARGSDGNNPHTPEAIDPIVVAAIGTLKEDFGAKRIGALGYCFGAKYAVRHYRNGINVGYLAHPSFVTEEELGTITGPLSIAAADVDDIFPDVDRHKSEQILRRTGLPFQICLYSNVAHGFAVRGDLSKREQRFAKEQAFRQAVEWFNEYL
ncbi:hypothetical protein ACJ41O_007343 [Fusarium nematophilum]